MLVPGALRSGDGRGGMLLLRVPGPTAPSARPAPAAAPASSPRARAPLAPAAALQTPTCSPLRGPRAWLAQTYVRAPGSTGPAGKPGWPESGLVAGWLKTSASGGAGQHCCRSQRAAAGAVPRHLAGSAEGGNASVEAAIALGIGRSMQPVHLQRVLQPIHVLVVCKEAPALVHQRAGPAGSAVVLPLAWAAGRRWWWLRMGGGGGDQNGINSRGTLARGHGQQLRCRHGGTRHRPGSSQVPPHKSGAAGNACSPPCV